MCMNLGVISQELSILFFKVDSQCNVGPATSSRLAGQGARVLPVSAFPTLGLQVLPRLALIESSIILTRQVLY